MNLLTFLRSVLPLVNPELVFVTGDITDAKDAEKVKVRFLNPSVNY
jgi:hypothetical protein